MKLQRFQFQFVQIGWNIDLLLAAPDRVRELTTNDSLQGTGMSEPKTSAAQRARILYAEECPSRDTSYHYILNDANMVIKVPSQKATGKTASSLSDHRDASRLFLFFRSVFLPAGFPHSVSRDYVAYQTWDTVQAFASSISSSLATRVKNVHLSVSSHLQNLICPFQGCVIVAIN